MDAGEEAPASGRNTERRQKMLGPGRRREEKEVWRRSPHVLEPRRALQVFRRSSGLQEAERCLVHLEKLQSEVFTFSLEKPLQGGNKGHVPISACCFGYLLLFLVSTVRLDVVVSTATWSYISVGRVAAARRSEGPLISVMLSV